MIRRFIDLPIESCGKASAMKICVQLGLPDKLMILLRFGALTCDEVGETTNFEHIMNRYVLNIVSYNYLLLIINEKLSLIPGDLGTSFIIY